MSRLEENNLKKKLIHNGFWLYIFTFLIAPSGYLLKVMIARELTVEDIGLFYSIIGLISIISGYNDLGLTEALQYFLPKYLLQKNTEKAHSLIWFTWSMQFFSGILISSLLFFGAPWLAKHYFESALALPLLRIFCIYFLIINLYQVLNSLFFATQQIKRSQFTDFMRMWGVVLFTAGSIFIFDTFDVLRYSWYWLGGVVIGVCVALIGVYKLYPRVFTYSLKSIKQHLSIKERTAYGRRVMLGQSAGNLYGQVNQQLVLVFLGAAAAGIWAYYLTFFTITSVVSGPIISYLFPLFNELYEKGDQGKIKELYSYLGLGLLVFGILGGISAYYISPRVSVVLFGEEFRQSGELFQIFAPWIFTSPLIGIVFADIASRGWVRERVYILLIGLIISFSSSYFLIINYQLIGSVYGHIIGTISLLFAVGCVYKMKGFRITQIK